MRTSAVLSTFIGFTAVNAAQLIGDFGVPKTIKTGEKFNILGHHTIGQGYQDAMIMFGISGPENPDFPYQAGDMGTIFAGPFDLAKFEDQVYNLTIPDVMINDFPNGPAIINGLVVELAGAFKQASLATFKVETEIGDATSEEYNYTKEKGSSCKWV